MDWAESCRPARGVKIHRWRRAFYPADNNSGFALKKSASAVLAIFASISGSFARPVARFRAAAGGVFPLGFGRQAVGFAFLFAEPFAKRVGVIPGHVDHRLIGRRGKAWVSPIVFRIAPLEFLLRLIEPQPPLPRRLSSFCSASVL